MKFKDITGLKFNYFFIINKITDNAEALSRNLWLCKCICGNERQIRGGDLINGIAKSCGCKRPRELTNQKFGHLTVIKRAANSNAQSKSVQWLCKCDCGKERIVYRSNLVGGHRFTHCGCLNPIQRGGCKEMRGKDFSSIRIGAKNRNIPFNLNVEQLWNLFLKQDRKCALTGKELNFNSSWNSRDKTASLDRIDNTKGYTIENVQWVHKDINYMKQDYTQEEFIRYCHLVAKQHPIT